MPSVLVVTYDSSTGSYKAAKIGSAQIADLAITSALIAANIIATPHILNQGLLSSVFGANVIATPHILNQGILSASFGAAIIAQPHIANQGLLSANYGAASIGGAHIAAASITSGKYGAQSITEGDLASGISIDISEVAQEPNYRAADLISAFMAVQFSASGYFNLARPNSLTTMPALGLAATTITSGLIGTFQYTGRMTNTTADLSGVANWNFSGYEGDLLFLISGGYLGRTPPALSGDCVQRIGKIVASQTIFVRPELQFVQLAE